MNIEALENLKSISSELLRETKKLKKLSEKAGDRDLSVKQATKARIDADWQAMHVRKLEYKAHAVAVDAGIADVREASEYEAITFNPDGWHEYQYTPDKPSCLKAS